MARKKSCKYVPIAAGPIQFLKAKAYDRIKKGRKVKIVKDKYGYQLKECMKR